MVSLGSSLAPSIKCAALSRWQGGPKIPAFEASATVSRGFESAPYGGSLPCGHHKLRHPPTPSSSLPTAVSHRAGTVINYFCLFSGLTHCWLVESDYCLSKIAAFCLLAGAPLAKAKVLGLIKSSKTGLSRAKICPVSSDLFWSSNFRALFERTTQ